MALAAVVFTVGCLLYCGFIVCLGVLGDDWCVGLLFAVCFSGCCYTACWVFGIV